MSELSEMRCTACRGGEPTLTDAEMAELRPQVPEWQVVQRGGIKRLEQRRGGCTPENFLITSPEVRSQRIRPERNRRWN